MRTAREVAHAIVCERQDSEWCHWTTDRSFHAHYCDTLTAAFEARDAEMLARCAAQVEIAGVCETCSHVGCVAARQAKRRIRSLASSGTDAPQPVPTSEAAEDAKY